MTIPRLPEHWEELAAGYALGDLSEEEAAQLQRLLQTHPELQSELEQFEQTLTLLPQSGSAPPAPPHLRSQLLTNAIAPAPPRPARRSVLPWGSIASAAAVLLLALGFDNWRLRQQLSQAEATLNDAQQQLRDSQAVVASLRQATPQLFALEGTGPLQTVAGNAVLAPGTQEIAIALSDLPQLPAGQVYRLWAIAPEAPVPIFCGQFAPDAAGSFRKTWTPAQKRVFQARITQLAVTIETTTTSQQTPQGIKVMQSI